MKVLKHKNLMNLLYATLIALPLFSILGRVLYTQWNQNAKDSYSDNFIQKATLVDNTSLDMIGANYQVNYWNGTGISGAEYSNFIKYSSISINWYDYGASTSNTYNGFRFAYNAIQLTSGNNNNVTATLNNIWGNTLNSFTYIYDSGTLIYTNTTYSGYSKVYLLTTMEDKLDNAFDYSLKQFVTDNDYGNFDLTSWFSNMFLSNNAQNNLYIHFINWYLNYVLLVSLIWVLFLLIIWFVNFARRLLESSFDKADRLGG